MITMKKQIRAMMIGAHADDCDLRCGGMALKYAQAGHKVKFLSLCDGSGGHHEMGPEEIAARRKQETQNIAKLAGIEYDVWDVPDCELMADLETRKRLVREIRQFNPDIIFCHRSNDYHADHRNAALLVQDASYLLIVPNFCPDVPAMKKTPVILYYFDRFKTPPFVTDIAVGIDEVFDQKIEMLACHESQFFEWLPYTSGTLDQVPEGREERIEWLHEPRIPRNGEPLDPSLFHSKLLGSMSEYRDAIPAYKSRQQLIDRYGQDKGSKIMFAEVFAVSEYGRPMSIEESWDYIPF